MILDARSMVSAAQTLRRNARYGRGVSRGKPVLEIGESGIRKTKALAFARA